MVKGNAKNKVLELYSNFEDASEYHFVYAFTALGSLMLYGSYWNYCTKQKENAWSFM